MIKIIHQTAKDIDSISDEFIPFVESVKRHHPDWKYMFWSDKDNEQLIRQQFPDMMNIYNQCSPIQKSDLARYCVLYVYGGLYVDIDMYCNRSLEPIIHPNVITLAPSPPLFPGKNTYTNYLMYSPPRQNFWIQVLKKMKENINKWYINTNQKVSSTTGNLLLSSVTKGNNIQIFDNKKIYNLFCPHDLNRLKKDKNIYAFHYGGTSRPQNNWSGGVSRFFVLQECKLKKLCGIRPNAYQLPILSISIILVILIITIVFILKR